MSVAAVIAIVYQFGIFVSCFQIRQLYALFVLNQIIDISLFEIYLKVFFYRRMTRLCTETVLRKIRTFIKKRIVA